MQRVDWRRRLVSWIFGLARHKARDGIPYDEWDDSWQQVGANGLSGDLTWEEFVADRSWRSQNPGGTRPPQLLTWSGEKWLLPAPGRGCDAGEGACLSWATVRSVPSPPHRFLRQLHPRRSHPPRQATPLGQSR